MTIESALRAITDEQARYWTKLYFGLNGQASFSGAHFHSFGAEDSDQNAFTVSDLYSMVSLSASIPIHAGMSILNCDAGRLTDLLAKIRVDVSLEAVVAQGEFEEHLGPESPAWQLWNTLSTYKGVGPTRVSKLMSRKRPALIPIEDSVILEVIDSDGKNTWNEWKQAFIADAKLLNATADLVREEAGEVELSTLRALDIVLWMKGIHDRNCETFQTSGECRQVHYMD